MHSWFFRFINNFFPFPTHEKVSWIRLRDFHLLTIGSLTFSSDDRFVVRPASHSINDWSLQIKHVTLKDEGESPRLV